MSRVRRSNNRLDRRKKILDIASGYYGQKGRCYRQAKLQVEKSLAYAYDSRRQRRRDFRTLWIARINAGCRLLQVSYSRFICGLKKAGVNLDRRALSELAIHDPAGFAALVKFAAA